MRLCGNGGLIHRLVPPIHCDSAPAMPRCCFRTAENRNNGAINMASLFTRRSFTLAAGSSLASGKLITDLATEDDKPDRKPVEAEFTRDYEAPGFKPSWKKPQINRQMAADFVIYAHSSLEMTKMLLDREPGLLNATLDWGGGDWDGAPGGSQGNPSCPASPPTPVPTLPPALAGGPGSAAGSRCCARSTRGGSRC